MPSLKDIKSRISSIKNTQKITSAMKMVAGAKLARAQENVEAARPYAAKMSEVIGNLVERAEDSGHPLLDARENPERVLVYAISSDRGLCGGFNSYLFRKVDKFIADEQLSGEKISVVTAGTKGETYFRRTRRHSEAHFDDVIDLPGFEEASRVAKHAVELFTSGDYDNVYIAYNEFVSAIEYETRLVPLLPLSKELFESAEGADAATESADYIYEPGEEELLAQMLPSYVEVLVLQALLESYAAEWSSRMAAMDSATKNASDMIDSLTLQYNRARQAYITKEICEIVSGAESLKG